MAARNGEALGFLCTVLTVCWGPIIHTMLWHNSQQSSGLGEEKAQKDVCFAVNEKRRAEVGLRMAHNGTY